jgi:hypothetical protein
VILKCMHVNIIIVVVVEKDLLHWVRTSHLSLIHLKFLNIKLLEQKRTNNRTLAHWRGAWPALYASSIYLIN